MKKKTVKKARSTKRTSSKKSRSLFANIAIGKFRFTSAIVLGALVLMVGGVLAYTKVTQTSVLGAKTSVNQCISITSDDPYTRKCLEGFTADSTIPSGYYYSYSKKCVPNSPEVSINDTTLSKNAFDYCSKVGHTIYVKVVDASNPKKLTLFENIKINVSTSLVQMPSQTVTVNTNGRAQFNNQYGGPITNNLTKLIPSGQKGGIYQFSPSSQEVHPGTSNQCGNTENNPCVFKVKIVALPNSTNVCKTTSKNGVRHNNSICTQVTIQGKECRTAQVRYTNCRPQTCKERGNYCTTLLSCKHVGGLQVSAPGCSTGQICCD